MNSTKPGSGRFFDDVSRLMTNAMGVAQGAKDEAETAMKGWVDRWLADRNLVTRDEFEAVREMAIKARSENAELRALIAAMGGTKAQTVTTPAGGTAGPAGFAAAAAQAPHVSAVDAPASGSMTAPAGTGAAGQHEAPHVTEADAPASGAMPDHRG